MPIKPELVKWSDEMRLWRRQLHANPETAYEERQTAEFVAVRLAKWGIEVHRGLGITGVVGTLKVGNGTRKIGLRADMDALSVEERNDFDHRSCSPGKMHACGHDGHMVMLLGAAKYLSQTRNFNGTIHFIFQPAEEIQVGKDHVPGGRRMIADGLFERFPVDAVFALHNMPLIPEGKLAFRSGPIMASSDVFEVKIIGKDTHGAWPHLGIDAIGVASEIVLGFNQIVARTVDPLDSAIISVTQFNAGYTSNVIPETATLVGTTRTFSVAMQDNLELRMRRLCDGIASAHGAKVVFSYNRHCPPTVNHFNETEFAASIAARVVGQENVLKEVTPAMAGEDFAWMLMAKKGSYIWIGNGPKAGNAEMLHSATYDFNDRILPVGASFWAELAESWLQ